MSSCNGTTTEARGYAPVNGLKMYYEIEGTGDPLVWDPSSLRICRGVNPYPALVQSHTVITVDLQGHGRTADIPERPAFDRAIRQRCGWLVENILESQRPTSLAKVTAAMRQAMVAIRYPELVGRVVTYAATFGPPRDCLKPSDNAL